MIKAYVFLKCDIGYEKSLLSSLKQIESVKDAHGTFGIYDIVVKLEATSEEFLIQTIAKNIRNMKKINGTLTLLVDKNDVISKNLTDEEKATLQNNSAMAYIAIIYKKSDESNIIHTLKNIPEIIEGDMVVGYYDLICKISTPSYNDISDVVTKKIRRIRNIKSTSTINIIP